MDERTLLSILFFLPVFVCMEIENDIAGTSCTRSQISHFTKMRNAYLRSYETRGLAYLLYNHNALYFSFPYWHMQYEYLFCFAKAAIQSKRNANRPIELATQKRTTHLRRCRIL